MRAALRLGFILGIAVAVHAQSGVGVEIDEVVDNSSHHDNGAFQSQGALELRGSNGTGLDRPLAARLIVKEARTTGNSLAQPKQVRLSRRLQHGTCSSLCATARAATSVAIKGSVELYAPAAIRAA